MEQRQHSYLYSTDECDRAFGYAVVIEYLVDTLVTMGLHSPKRVDPTIADDVFLQVYTHAAHQLSHAIDAVGGEDIAARHADAVIRHRLRPEHAAKPEAERERAVEGIRNALFRLAAKAQRAAEQLTTADAADAVKEEA